MCFAYALTITEHARLRCIIKKDLEEKIINTYFLVKYNNNK